jgi:hypothetical protein
MSSAKLIARQTRIKDEKEEIAAVYRELRSALATAMIGAGIPATLREIKSILAESAGLQRETKERIALIEAKQKQARALKRIKVSLTELERCPALTQLIL